MKIIATRNAQTAKKKRGGLFLLFLQEIIPKELVMQ